MPIDINPNTSFTFITYEPQDDGWVLTFRATNPGPGRRTDYDILLTDGELNGVTNQQDLRNLVENKLNRKIRAAGVASKLDPFIGQSLII